jgi:hypothetical protein
MERKNLQKLDDLVSTALDLEQKLNRPRAQVYRVNSATNNRPRMPNGPLICYNCSREGHFSRDCQMPRRPRYRQKNNNHYRLYNIEDTTRIMKMRWYLMYSITQLNKHVTCSIQTLSPSKHALCRITTLYHII